MKRLTMKHLRYFEAVARYGHFGHAAAACSISQPALSVQIKELELLLGAPLFERSARKVRLTTLGEALRDRAKVILREVDEIDDLVRTSREPFTGRLGIGVIPTIAPYLLPNFIRKLGTRYPDLDLRPRETITRGLVEELSEGRLDFAIVALPISERLLHEEFLFDEEFVLVRPRIDASEPVPDARGLRKMRLLLLEEGHCFRDQALAYCHEPSQAARDLMEGSSLSTLVGMVAAGIGVTLIPEMAIETETRSTEVSVARLPSPRPKRTVGMIWRRTSPMAAQYREIADLLRR